MKTLKTLLGFCLFIVLSQNVSANAPVPKDGVRVWWHPLIYGTHTVPTDPRYERKSHPESTEYIPPKTSSYCFTHEIKYLVVVQGNREARIKSVVLKRISLSHEETNKVVCLSPWSQVGNPGEYYEATYNPNDNTITITWAGRPMVVLSEDELNKETTPDLRKIRSKEDKLDRSDIYPMREMPPLKGEPKES